MRKKPNLIPRMERCAAVHIREPEALRGRWATEFPQYGTIHLELGCGKGRFTCGQALLEPEALLLALEKVPDAMVVAMERVTEQQIPNVRFLERDAVCLPDLFQPGEVSRLYINFCDPWPKSRDAKLRLTAPGFLRLYADLLPLGGEIRFKTDNTPLFDWSIARLEEEGWALSEVTHDLHAAGPVGVMTDYEAKFYAQGMKINRLVATRTADTRTTAAGPVPRLRNASLTDARGFDESAAAAEEKD
ncbi:MAG: tRNA (guanosine(46)-N7)-methyltransferase TrmB [Oscillospiraceae bacterium]|nr:tRNA (guanosine(46)-N7)-methyltransferase TrmB [Oscillospiraceae bacterium]